MTTNNRLVWLFERYYAQTATGEEQQELFALLDINENDETIACQLKQYWEQLQHTGADTPFTKEKADALLCTILGNTTHSSTVVPIRRKNHRYWYAAAAVLVLAAAGWLFATKQQPVNTTTVKAPVVITPGSNKATLTLADGSLIELNNAQQGVIGQQGNASIVKKNSGELAYTTAGNTAAPVYNTLQTPAGGQYHVQLPDGTQVWLNAASSLHYPTAFTGSERTVTLTGEAYFEVAQQTKQPFVVQLSGSRVTVLGTHFNINDYTDENATRTTLLEGAVQVSTGQAQVVLHPGNQSVQHHGEEKLETGEVDGSAAIAWKNGLFQFDHYDIAAIMRQLSRWYQVSVQYENGVPAKKITGKISRTASLDEVLQILAFAGVHCRLQQSTIIVQ
ncbi:FecR family protein [Deminuibacter soli]|nr:FecR domain-containing protein [Deminuibacter soli]